MKKAVLILFTLILGIGQSFAERVTDRSWYDDVQGSKFTISTFEQLCALADIVNDEEDDFRGKTITLTEDITLSGNWIPIGDYEKPFEGTFEGSFDNQAHRILNFSCVFPERDNLGFFGCIGESGTIIGLHIEIGGDVSGNNNVGVLAGVSHGIIKRSSASTPNNGSDEYYIYANGTGGGLVGHQVSGLINHCSTTISLKGTLEKTSEEERTELSLGGLVGIAGGTIFQCSAGGNVYGELSDEIMEPTTLHIGGLVGRQNSTSRIEKSSSSTSVHGKGMGRGLGNGDGYIIYIGGLVGSQANDILNCYSSYGNIQSEVLEMFTGGLVGYHYSGNITNCYSAISILPLPDENFEDWHIGGFAGHFDKKKGAISRCYFDKFIIVDMEGIGSTNSTPTGLTPKTTNEMFHQSTYSFWDFTNIWEIYTEGSVYPSHRIDLLAEPSDPEVSVQPRWWDDSWYEEQFSPYIITTAAQFATFAKLVSDRKDDFDGKTVILAEDLDLSEFMSEHVDYFLSDGWHPIGDESFKFNGMFNGNKKTILGLEVNTEIENAGLFGVIGLNGTVKDLTITLCGDIKGGSSVGILAGTSYGIISNCVVESESSLVGSGFIGGLVGKQNNGTISNCSATAIISGLSVMTGGLVGSVRGNIFDCQSSGSIEFDDTYNADVFLGGFAGESHGTISRSFSVTEIVGKLPNAHLNAGGFVGGLYDGQINECYATGGSELTGNGIFAGGFAGIQAATINDCYATGKVLADANTLDVGGFVGYYHSGPLTNCYSTGEVTHINGSEIDKAGGFLGYLNYDDIKNCYFDKEKSGKANGIGYATSNLTADITAKTTAEMSQKTTYKNWDFYGIWKMDQTTGYPILRMGDTETPPNPQPEPDETYTITLNIATYISASKETGSYIINEGDGFNLTFHLENSEGYTNSDILFLLDGKEIDINSFLSGTNYRFTLNNIKADHTIDIALKTYKITVPQIEGLFTDPEAGTYDIPYGEPFTITFTLEDKYDQSMLVVLINGKVVDLSALRSTSFTYTIDKVLEPITIEVKGIELNDPTSNGTVNPHSVDIYTSNGAIYLKTNIPLPVDVYSISGILIKSLTVIGEEKINLSSGIYIVRSLYNNYKVIVK